MEGRSPSCLEAEAEELTSEASLNSEVSRALATASGDEVADGSPEDSLEDSTDDGLKDRPSSDLKLSPLRNDVQASSLCSLLRAAAAGTSQGLKLAEARIGPWVEVAMHWEPNQLLAGAVHFSYFMLFASLYTQLPGLHGPQGIDPYHLSKGLNDSLLLRHGRRGRYWAAELAALLGLGASGAATALPALRSGWTGLTLSGAEWLLWRDFMVSGASSFPMGMTYLAMEGSIGAAAFALNAPRLASWFWRWCLFRGLLAGGAHKLLLCDASWNNLSAVHWHFQGNPNPSALSWYAFRLTSSYPSLGHLATASTLAIEMVAPFLFFSPNRGLRMLGLAGNSLLQLGILASGNYGPLNFYFLALGLSLLQSERRRQLADTDASRAVEEDTVWPAAAVGLGSAVAIGAATRLLPTSPATCPSAGHAVYAQLTALLSSAAGFQGLISLTSGPELAVGLALLGASQSVFILDLLGYMPPHSELLQSALLTSSPWLQSMWEDADAAFQRFVVQPASTIAAALPSRVFDPPPNFFSNTTGVEGRPVFALEGAQTFFGPWRHIPMKYVDAAKSNLTAAPWPHAAYLDLLWWDAPHMGGSPAWLSRMLRGILDGLQPVLDLIDRPAFEASFGGALPKYVRLVPKTMQYTTTMQSHHWWRTKPADLGALPWSQCPDESLGLPLGSPISREHLRDLLGPDEDKVDLQPWPASPLRALSEALGPADFVRTAAIALGGCHLAASRGANFLWGSSTSKKPWTPAAWQLSSLFL